MGRIGRFRGTGVRTWILVACGMLASTAFTSSAVAGASTVRAGAASPVFGRAIAVALPANADLAAGGRTLAVACPARGTCAAGGLYIAAGGHDEAFVVTESAGHWGRARTVRLPAGALANPGAEVNGISCPSAGLCVAVGQYFSAHGQAGFIVTLSRGTWGTAIPIRLPVIALASATSQLKAIDCVAPGSCVATGDFSDAASGSQAMAVAQTAGRWQRAVKIAAPAGAAADPATLPVSVSCVARGDCVASGSYTHSAITDYRPMAMIETGGRWQRAVSIARPADATSNGSSLGSVACTSAGHCTAVGSYPTAPDVYVPIVAVDSGGHWSHASPVTIHVGSHPVARYFGSISCLGPTSCVVAGGYQPTATTFLSFLVLYQGGHWKGAMTLLLPPDAASAGHQVSGLYGVSCASSGYCAAAGYYSSRGGVTLPMISIRP